MPEQESDDVKFAEMKGDIKVIHSKLDGCITSIDKLTSGLGSRVQEHGEEISGIKKDMSNNYQYISSVNRKVDSHIEGHWKWIAIVIGLISIATFIGRYIKNG